MNLDNMLKNETLTLDIWTGVIIECNHFSANSQWFWKNTSGKNTALTDCSMQSRDHNKNVNVCTQLNYVLSVYFRFFTISQNYAVL